MVDMLLSDHIVAVNNYQKKEQTTLNSFEILLNGMTNLKKIKKISIGVNKPKTSSCELLHQVHQISSENYLVENFVHRC